MAKNIAIVEDEVAISDNYKEMLERQGYKVKIFDNRNDAWNSFQSALPDLVLLDIGLRDEIEGGFDLCRDLRSKSKSLPIIFLTARDSDFDTISGLRLGADDYLTKDISLPHLAARISAIFRRQEALSKPEELETLIKHDELLIDKNRMTVKWKDKPLDLTITEFWIISTIARHPGHVKNRDQLMEDANIYVDENTITSHIKRIRKKFIAIDQYFDHIETVYGMGYRWKG
ncbi:MAG: proteobacterial dedicated sortase system response regulator [Gammaproteobacteria bacterium]|nr:MAG: proteobacterial dedicated sortase system response regulator [Gammaproteobacteria bacterium]